MMRSVAYVTTTFPTLAAFLENEVHRLRERGVDVRVWTLRGVSREFQPEHAPLLAITRSVGSPASPRAWLDLARWLVRRPHVLVPDVLRMVWASRGSLYALVGHLGYLPAAARVATLLEREQIERVHGAWAHFPASVAYLAARLAGRRFSMAGHAGSDLHRTRAFLSEKVRAADFVTACVRGNAEMLATLAPGGRVEWIYHGVDRRRFDGGGRAREPEPTFVMIGRLARTKGFDVALRALGMLRRRGIAPRVVVIGEGPERPALEAIVAAEGLGDRITLPGNRPQSELLPLYRGAWALIAPSRVLANGRQDGIPNVVVEALAMGLPCIGTRAAGLEEAIADGVNGLLVPPDDPAALATAIERLAHDPAEVDRMSEAARGRIATDFDAERNFERLWALFEAPPRGTS